MVNFKSISPADFAKLPPEQRAVVLANVDKETATKLQAALSGSEQASNVPNNPGNSIFKAKDAKTSKSAQPAETPHEQSFGESVAWGVKDGVKNFAGMVISGVTFGTVNGKEVMDAAEETIEGKQVKNRNFGLGGAIYNKAKGTVPEEGDGVSVEMAYVAMGLIPGGGTLAKGAKLIENAAAPVVEKAAAGLIKNVTEKTAASVAAETVAKEAAEKAADATAKTAVKGLVKEVTGKTAETVTASTAKTVTKKAIETSTGSTAKVAANMLSEKGLSAIAGRVESFGKLSGAAQEKILKAASSINTSKLTAAQIKAGVRPEDIQAAAVDTLSTLYKAATEAKASQFGAKSVNTLIEQGSMRLAEQRAAKEAAEKAAANAARKEFLRTPPVTRTGTQSVRSRYRVKPAAQSESYKGIDPMKLALAKYKKESGKALTIEEKNILGEARWQDEIRREQQRRRYGL